MKIFMFNAIFVLVVLAQCSSAAAAVSCSQSELLQNQLFFVKGIVPATAAVPTQLFQIDTSFSTAPQASPGRPGQAASKRVSLVTTNKENTVS